MQVYSVVHGVVRLELHVEAPGHNLNVNQYLIDMGFADHAEEGFVSKVRYARLVWFICLFEFYIMATSKVIGVGRWLSWLRFW